MFQFYLFPLTTKLIFLTHKQIYQRKSKSAQKRKTKPRAPQAENKDRNTAPQIAMASDKTTNAKPRVKRDSMRKIQSNLNDVYTSHSAGETV